MIKLTVGFVYKCVVYPSSQIKAAQNSLQWFYFSANLPIYSLTDTNIQDGA